MSERRKAGKFTINGVPLDPIEKTVSDGLRIVQFRTDVTVSAIKRSMAVKAGGGAP
jgi:predicted transcriptional regulator